MHLQSKFNGEVAKKVVCSPKSKPSLSSKSGLPALREGLQAERRTRTSGGEAIRAQYRMPALARAPVLPKSTPIGALIAQLSVQGRGPVCPLHVDTSRPLRANSGRSRREAEWVKIDLTRTSRARYGRKAVKRLRSVGSWGLLLHQFNHRVDRFLALEDEASRRAVGEQSARAVSNSALCRADTTPPVQNLAFGPNLARI